MKKILFLLISIPLIFISCKKEDCSCGTTIDSGTDHIPYFESSTGESHNVYYLVVENNCTSNIDTFFVNSDQYGYYFNKDTYCSGSW
jgi:hypothetical protein